MLKLAFTPEVIEALRRERFHHPHPHVQLGPTAASGGKFTVSLLEAD